MAIDGEGLEEEEEEEVEEGEEGEEGEEVEEQAEEAEEDASANGDGGEKANEDADEPRRPKYFVNTKAYAIQQAAVAELVGQEIARDSELTQVSGKALAPCDGIQISVFDGKTEQIRSQSMDISITGFLALAVTGERVAISQAQAPFEHPIPPPSYTILPKEAPRRGETFHARFCGMLRCAVAVFTRFGPLLTISTGQLEETPTLHDDDTEYATPAWARAQTACPLVTLSYDGRAYMNFVGHVKGQILVEEKGHLIQSTSFFTCVAWRPICVGPPEAKRAMFVLGDDRGVLRLFSVRGPSLVHTAEPKVTPWSTVTVDDANPAARVVLDARWVATGEESHLVTLHGRSRVVVWKEQHGTTLISTVSIDPPYPLAPLGQVAVHLADSSLHIFVGCGMEIVHHAVSPDRPVQTESIAIPHSSTPLCLLSAVDCLVTTSLDQNLIVYSIKDGQWTSRCVVQIPCSPRTLVLTPCGLQLLCFGLGTKTHSRGVLSQIDFKAAVPYLEQLRTLRLNMSRGACDPHLSTVLSPLCGVLMAQSFAKITIDGGVGWYSVVHALLKDYTSTESGVPLWRRFQPLRLATAVTLRVPKWADNPANPVVSPSPLYPVTSPAGTAFVCCAEVIALGVRESLCTLRRNPPPTLPRIEAHAALQMALFLLANIARIVELWIPTLKSSSEAQPALRLSRAHVERSALVASMDCIVNDLELAAKVARASGSKTVAESTKHLRRVVRTVQIALQGAEGSAVPQFPSADGVGGLQAWVACTRLFVQPVKCSVCSEEYSHEYMQTSTTSTCPKGHLNQICPITLLHLAETPGGHPVCFLCGSAYSHPPGMGCNPASKAPPAFAWLYRLEEDSMCCRVCGWLLMH